MIDLERLLRLPSRPEYKPWVNYLATLGGDDLRCAIREMALRDRYFLAVILGYDTPEFPFDEFHLWALRKRIPELRAIPGCQSSWFAPRSTFKTVMEMVDICHSILSHPEEPLAIASWSLLPAVSICMAVRGFLERPLIKWLFPDVCWERTQDAPIWEQRQFVVKRPAESRDPSLFAFALEAPGTSFHFRRIYIDDAVERRNAFTEDGIAKVKRTLQDIRSLLTAPDTGQVEVRGTLWDPEDWHCSVILPSLDWKVERHPAVVEDPAEFEDAAPPPPGLGLKPGDLVFPGRYNRETLAREERTKGPWHFGGQIALRMAAAADALWKPEQVRNYYRLDELPRSWNAVLVLDLATEAPETDDTDDTALVLAVAGPPGPDYRIWLVDGIAETHWAWEDVARQCFEWGDEWGATLFIEEVGAFTSFETALLHHAEGVKHMIPHRRLKRVPGSGGKIKERIKVLSSWYEQRRIMTRDPASIADERSRIFFQKYERQALRWPRTAHDDALEVVAETTVVCLPPAPGVPLQSVRPPIATRARVR